MYFYRSLDCVKHFSLRSDQGKFVFGVGEFSDAEQLMEHFQNYPIIGGETGSMSLKLSYFNCFSQLKLSNLILYTGIYEKHDKIFK